MLEEYGYKTGEFNNEWTKDIWTIRFFTDGVEVFNTPRINTPGEYYKTLFMDKELLELVLLEIENKIK